VEPIMTNLDKVQRESHLVAAIQRQLPDLAKACAGDVAVIVLYQDSFAADYQEREYILLGMAIKYAGLCGKDVQVIGRNRQTLTQQRPN
jgi:hypothetical protein